jgi:[citrate (pro-3S)-lyase] ligase
LSSVTGAPYDFGFTELQIERLNQYKSVCGKLAASNGFAKLKVGAIVMNCNPFTFGHRYLVETALLKSQFLVVFVVQEDKSEFPFSDRLELVKQNLSDLKNVIVIPSGQFIISRITFSEYFNKKELQDADVDTSLDVTLFATHIAPTMNISVRFVGTEPFDNVTKRYNDEMKQLLPRYGIELCEIQRKELLGEVISASKVRGLLQEERWEELQMLCPPRTLSYLKELYYREDDKFEK